ncbi:MAG TPA: glycogen/starch synthase [Roseiflexaceae bacterium]|nr:glycogen/starch synthase [Roseiflexaceae bacterium]
MNVLYTAAEVAPLIKTGGLADVAGALPPALRRLGHDARIVMPCYQRIRASDTPIDGPTATAFLPAGDQMELMRVFTTLLGDTPVYLLDIPSAFDRDTIFGAHDDDRRFILFARGIAALLLHLREQEQWRADVVHANDWHTGLLPNYIKTAYASVFGELATVFTIHNLAYQGFFNPFTLYLAGLDGNRDNYVNFLARGIRYADIISTVSPTYAQEILTPEYGEQLDDLLRTRQEHLAGIINGIDYEVFNPATDQHIAANYSANNIAGKTLCKAALQRESGFAVDPHRPLLGIVTRLVEQKGLGLLDAVIPWLVAQTDADLVLLGSGEPAMERAFAEHMRRFPSRVHVQLRFDAALAQRIYAGCDAFLMPSRYEPSGLGQLIALRYGAIPIVRATGGLNDTVREGYEGNGFRFHPYTPQHLADAIARCLTCFRDTNGWPILRDRGMREDHSWAASAREYAALYEWAMRVT